MKLLFLDTETTGLNPEINGVIQVAMCYEDSYIDYRIRPPKGTVYDKEALKINGITKKQIKKFERSDVQLKEIIKWMGWRVGKYDKNDKFVLVGYNVKFDKDFMFAWAEKEGFNFLGSYIDHRVIDVLTLARTAQFLKQLPGEPENFKLETICKLYGIEPGGHDALEDMFAVRKLFYEIIKGWE